MNDNLDDKICTKCNTNKILAEFGPDKSVKSGLRSQCKACVNALQNARRAANPNARKSYDAEYYLKHANDRNACTRAYMIANPEKARKYKDKWRVENPEKNKESKIKCYINNPELLTVKRHRRRALILNAPGSHTSDDLKRIFLKQNGCCNNPFCNDDINEKSAKHLDHIVPLSRGGSNSPDNLQYLCKFCNISKKDRDWVTWLEIQATRVASLRKADSAYSFDYT